MTHTVTFFCNYVLQWFSTYAKRNPPHPQRHHLRIKPRNGWTSPVPKRMGVTKFNWDHPLPGFKLRVSWTSKMRIQTTKQQESIFLGSYSRHQIKSHSVFQEFSWVEINRAQWGYLEHVYIEMSLWYAVTTCKCAASGNLLLLAATINDPWSLWWTISASLHCS